MALILTGGGVLAISGKLAGQVFSRNRSGPYIRSIGVPVNPNTQRQNTMRAIISLLATAWSVDLTQLQRDSWEVSADSIVVTNRLGAVIKLTGFNHYIRSNSFILQNGGIRVDDGPTNLTLAGQDPTMLGTIDDANQLVSVAFDDSLGWVDQDEGHMGIYMSIPQSPGTTFIGGPWRLAGTIDGDSTTPPTSPETFAVPFPVAENQLVAVRARIVEEDGRLSDLFQSDSFVTA